MQQRDWGDSSSSKDWSTHVISIRTLCHPRLTPPPPSLINQGKYSQELRKNRVGKAQENIKEICKLIFCDPFQRGVRLAKVPSRGSNSY